MADISKCQDILFALAEQKGYLTFDDIMKASDTFDLSVVEVDFLSEAIQLRGIILYEVEPLIGQVAQVDEDVLDYSRTDYDVIFNEIIYFAPQLHTLIEEIKTYPAPQWGEINQLARQKADGNRFARERLIKLYMRSVLKIALYMTKQYELDIEAAISSGFIGLINAVDRYDPSGFSAFHSYASMWIQQGIQRDCNPTWMDFYFPAHVKDKMFRTLQKYEQLTVGEEIGSPEFISLIKRIGAEVELPEHEVEKALGSCFSQQYCKLCIEKIKELETQEDELLPDGFVRNEEEVYKDLLQKDLRATVEQALSKLTEREAEVIRMRNGIGLNDVMTLEEIGSQMNITRERVRQIEEKAMRKLSNPRFKHQLSQYY